MKPSNKSSVLKYRLALRNVLGQAGLPSAPDVSDDWILAMVSRYVKVGAQQSVLDGFAYVVEHNPNCPAPYLVRMAGKPSGRAVIDRLPELKSNDCLGVGKTFEEAAIKALRKYHN